MTTGERFAKLDKRHHRFVQVPDPWHLLALGRFEWFRTAFREHRVHQGSGEASLHGGDIEPVWNSVDINGNLLQEWGFDQPAVIN